MRTSLWKCSKSYSVLSDFLWSLAFVLNYIIYLNVRIWLAGAGVGLRLFWLFTPCWDQADKRKTHKSNFIEPGKKMQIRHLFYSARFCFRRYGIGSFQQYRNKQNNQKQNKTLLTNCKKTFSINKQQDESKYRVLGVSAWCWLCQQWALQYLYYHGKPWGDVPVSHMLNWL